MSGNKAHKKLGRGLAALMGADAAGSGADSPQSLPIETLEPGPFQPRASMDPEELEELCASIRARGVLQPVLVRPHPERAGVYQIIAGERRWRASQLAGLHDIPVVVRALSDMDALAAALVENLQRSDLNAIEEAEGFARLSREFGLTQDELSSVVGKSRPHITNTMRLLQLPDAVKARVGQGHLSAGHARAILVHPDPVYAAHHIIEHGLSVRETENWVQEQTATPVSLRARAVRAARDPEIQNLERELRNHLGLAVNIQFDGKGGSIKISYKNLDQFDAVLALLRR